MPSLFGAYTCKELAIAIANHLERAEVQESLAVDLQVQRSPCKIEAYLIDEVIELDTGVDELAGKIISGLTEDEKKIIMASTQWIG